jgi:N-methylhydantoinase A/oxoprolinase/acetone carboxylase beta subunit
MKLVSRGDTTVVDAYLSPILRRYVDQVSDELGTEDGARLMFMQSNGGLTDARSCSRARTRSCRGLPAAWWAWSRRQNSPASTA